jgi:hypothetical protein
VTFLLRLSHTLQIRETRHVNAPAPHRSPQRVLSRRSQSSLDFEYRKCNYIIWNK